MSPFRRNGNERATVVPNVDPLADARAVAVDAERLAGSSVFDELRNELFGVLAWPEVVRGARNEYRLRYADS